MPGYPSDRAALQQAAGASQSTHQKIKAACRPRMIAGACIRYVTGVCRHGSADNSISQGNFGLQSARLTAGRARCGAGAEQAAGARLTPEAQRMLPRLDLRMNCIYRPAQDKF